MSEDSHSNLSHEFGVDFLDQLIRTCDNSLANVTVGTDEFRQLENLARAKIEPLAYKELGLKKGELCAVSGSARWSETVVVQPEEDGEDSDGDTIERKLPGQYITYNKHQGEVAGVEGIYTGFFARRLSGEDVPRLWCVFELDNSFSYKADELCEDLRVHMMFVDPCTLQVVPAERFEEPYIDEDLDTMEAGEPMLDELFSRSQIFARMLRSTAFRRMKHKQQIREVDNVLADTEAITGIRGSGIGLIAEYGYVVPSDVEGNPDYDADFRFVGLNDMVLNGVCLAVSSSSWPQIRRKAVRNDGDLLNKYDGLCLTLELDKASDLAEFSPVGVGDIVHVPLSGQAVGLMLHSTKPAR